MERAQAVEFWKHHLQVWNDSGADHDPNWWSNLVAGGFHGRVRAPGGAWFIVDATDLEGDERAATWQQVIAVQPDYAEYEHATFRHIPLVHLRRAVAEA